MVAIASPIRQMMVEIQHSLDASERLDRQSPPAPCAQDHHQHWLRRIEHLEGAVLAEVPQSLGDVVGILNCATTLVDRFDAFTDMTDWERRRIFETIKVAVGNCVPILTTAVEGAVELTRSELSEARRLTNIAQQREGR